MIGSPAAIGSRATAPASDFSGGGPGDDVVGADRGVGPGPRREIRRLQDLPAGDRGARDQDRLLRRRRRGRGGDWCPLCQPRADEDRGAAGEEEGDGEQDQGA